MRGPLVFGAVVLVVTGVWFALFPPPVALRTALPDDFGEVVEAEALDEPQRQSALIRRVLARQQAVYGERDASAAVSFWPGVQAPELATLFATLDRQELAFDECAIDVADSTATAACGGWLRYVPRESDPRPRSDRHAWTVRLQRAADEWTIVGVNAR
ncbi:MAG: hypothetical protein ABL986_03405 [Vicinamibacterales bacterium]